MADEIYAIEGPLMAINVETGLGRVVTGGEFKRAVELLSNKLHGGSLNGDAGTGNAEVVWAGISPYPSEEEKP